MEYLFMEYLFMVYLFMVYLFMEYLFDYIHLWLSTSLKEGGDEYGPVCMGVYQIVYKGHIFY